MPDTVLHIAEYLMAAVDDLAHVRPHEDVVDLTTWPHPQPAAPAGPPARPPGGRGPVRGAQAGGRRLRYGPRGRTRARTALVQELTDRARVGRWLVPEPVWEKPN
ncbi:hypothetical protein ACI2L1_26620 [Streptomyces sp. NPDC019531]|uniref:hypothetical protein n=1 Tax=Streptomyces sp. NPDC019531 TaxID=3365062 RepID=UPI00384BB1C7